MADPFGYWTFGGKNGLKGLASTKELLPDGVRWVTHPHPTNPAVLEDEVILYAIRTSQIARDQLEMLFPTLLPDEQDRLRTLFAGNKRFLSLVSDPVDYADTLQHNSVSAGVRTRLQ